MKRLPKNIDAESTLDDLLSSSYPELIEVMRQAGVNDMSIEQRNGVICVTQHRRKL